MHIIPKIFEGAPIVAAQSTRRGGVSAEPFHSLNLGLSVSDEKEVVMKNRELFFSHLGIDHSQIAYSKQVHGKQVLIAGSPVTEGGYDAVITNKQGVYPTVSVADCTPVLVYDKKNNAVAAIHAGWRGTVAKVVTHTLFKMQETYGTKGVDCKAYIGACIGYDHFEVGEDVAQHFLDIHKKFNTEKQKYFVDLKGANHQQLMSFGLSPRNIEVSPYCTFENKELFFSHRRDKGTTGRMMAVIGIK